MDEDRIARALARLEAAARRIEAAAPSARQDAGNPELEERHTHLLDEAGAALAELDRLIGTLEQ